jgi:hypothetical protein
MNPIPASPKITESALGLFRPRLLRIPLHGLEIIRGEFPNTPQSLARQLQFFRTDPQIGLPGKTLYLLAHQPFEFFANLFYIQTIHHPRFYQLECNARTSRKSPILPALNFDELRVANDE